MADVFCFGSPQKPAATASRTRSQYNRRVRLGQKRRPVRMDFSPQHACMARFDEPTFCPNDVSTLLARYPLLPQYPGGNDIPTPELIEDTDEEDETGGVPLENNDLDQEMTDALADTNLEGHETSHWQGHQCSVSGARSRESTEQLPRSLSASSTYVHRANLQTRQGHQHGIPAHTLRSYTSTSVLGSNHPRPHLQESWEEEDGHRLRFALDGEDISEVPLFATPGWTNEPAAGDTEGLPISHARPLPQLPDSQGDQDTGNETRPMQAASDNHEAQAGHQPAEDADHQGTLEDLHVEAVFEDDWMAVDDPRRSYDFADFMDTWRLRSLVDKQIPPFDPGMQPSIRLGRKPDEVLRKNVVPGKVDMQALHWQLLGPSRVDAMNTRAILHPSRRGVVTPPAMAKASSQSPRVREESAYRFRSFTSKHRASFSHYQLRNLLAAPDRADIFYANGSKVFRTSLVCSSAQRTVMDLAKASPSAANIRVTCLTTSHKVLLAGGFGGEYAILNLDSVDKAPLPTEGFVTHAYNGLVTQVHTFSGRRSGLPQAAFCSNDHKLRLMDIRTTTFTNTFAYVHAVNCSATAPDGRLRILVGDSNEAHITDAERGDVLVTLKGHQDHGFACAWAENGIHVATGAQDGKTLVWDARNWSHPLRSLPSSMSCPRSLHFTDNDSLVVAEDEDVVSIYDAGTFNKCQDIRFFGSIAGLALLDGGAEVAIANIDKTVGGLMTFERTAQGVSGGPFGRRMDAGAARQRLSMRRRGLEADMPSDLVRDVFV